MPTVHTTTANGRTGKRNGVGEEHYPDGSYYYGAFADDKRTGSAEITVTLENGMVYTGKNKFAFSNGDTYVGDYLGGKRNGSGKYIWASGQSYDGAWVNDVMEGNGTYDFGNGKAPYVGTFAAVRSPKAPIPCKRPKRRLLRRTRPHEHGRKRRNAECQKILTALRC